MNKLLCWLFGHLWITKYHKGITFDYGITHCTRCGIGGGKHLTQ